MVPPRRNISSACTNCRAKKTKCDGRKPFCSVCMKARQRCVYDDCDKRRLKAWKSAIADLERKNAQLEGIITSLQCNSFEDSVERLRQLRENPLPASHQAEIGGADSHGTDSYTPNSAPSISPSLVKDVSSSEKSHIRGLGEGAAVFDVGDMNLPPEEVTRHAVSAFFSCGSTLFNIMPRVACEDLIKTVYERPTETTKSVVCQLSAVAVVGSHYCTDEIPAFAKERFFQCASLLLPDQNATDHLVVMRVLACLAVYLILLKSATARTMTASGLNIARCNMQKYKHASLNEWLEWARVLRTLAFTECWLSATLGYKQDLGPDEIKVINDLAESELITNPSNLLTPSLIQSQAFKISFLSAQVYDSIRYRPDLLITDLQNVSAKLDTWFWELPDCLHLTSLTSPSASTITDNLATRRPLLFLHMINITSQINLYERVLDVTLKRIPPSDDLVACEVLRCRVGTQHTYESFAQELARMVRLLYDENCVLARCWLTINACYHSSLILLLNTAQRLALGLHTDPVLENLSYVRVCLQVLEICKNYDLAAMRLVDIVTPLYQRLWQSVEESEKTSEGKRPDEVTPTFSLSYEGENSGRTIPAHLAHVVQQAVAAMDLQYLEVWV